MKINVKSVLLYTAYTIIIICLNRAMSGVPLGLGLCFSILICGTNLFAAPVLYILASIVNLDLIFSLTALFEGAFVCAVTFAYRRSRKKIRAEAAAYMCVALAPFVAFSHWQGIDSLYFIHDPYILKTLAALAVVFFFWFCFKSAYALLFRLYRCRMRAEELICLAVVFTVSGVGLYNLAGRYFCLCIGAGLAIAAVRLFKNPSAVIAAIVIGLPIAIGALDLNYVTAFTLLSILALLFSGAGRFAPSVVSCVVFSAYLYLTGEFSVTAGFIVLRVCLLLICCALPSIPTDGALKRALNLLTVTKVLGETREERMKRASGDRLYKISEVFREIECAFKELDETVDEDAMKAMILTDLKESLCSSCEKRDRCAKEKVKRGFRKLIDAGCIKGKVSLVDLPADVTLNCSNPTEVIIKLNKLLIDFRRYTLEAENAKSGRALLANQAKGVAEVLKSCAVEFSRTSQNRLDLETELSRKLSEQGISCPEIAVNDFENPEIMITAVGKVNLAAVKDIIFKVTGRKFILKDKIVYDSDKCCMIFSAPPPFDAAFGVAYAIKDGEKISGDTHSVIKINEHSFLMALSDGMGSGEYAEKVSSTAISLIEAFYRAEMPTDTVLDTINKLICFSRDERFACIDIAAIDLNTLCASFIKIGSPAGIIVRKGEIKVLESNSLPLGIIETLHPTVSKETLKNGDTVVFMSDGITSSFPSTTELYEFLQTLKPLNPQSLADKILEGALALSGGANDDMTVVCTRIFARTDV